MPPTSKPPLRVADALIDIMVAIFILSLVFFYFIAFRDLSPRHRGFWPILRA